MTLYTKTSREIKKLSDTARAVQLPSARGRIFQGKVTKLFPKRVVLELERTVFVPKYERFFQKKTRLHARLPEYVKVNIGDLVKVQECRPLSKLIHHTVIEKVNSNGGEKI